MKRKNRGTEKEAKKKIRRILSSKKVDIAFQHSCDAERLSQKALSKNYTLLNLSEESKKISNFINQALANRKYSKNSKAIEYNINSAWINFGNVFWNCASELSKKENFEKCSEKMYKESMEKCFYK
jgi:hypothetical protein